MIKYQIYNYSKANNIASLVKYKRLNKEIKRALYHGIMT